MSDIRIHPWNLSSTETPPAAVVTSALERFADYLHDESKLSAPGILSLARPRSVSELRQVLQWLQVRGERFLLSAARTGVTGAAVAEEPLHLVSTELLKGVEGHKFVADEELEVSVLPGTTLAELETFCQERFPGYFFPVDATEKLASLGGMVSTNAGGARSFKYGSIRPWVVGVRVELVEGGTAEIRRQEHRAIDGVFSFAKESEILTLRSQEIPKPSVKSSVGYSFSRSLDAVDLFVGSEGTLGVISQVTLRLKKLPERRIAILQPFAEVEGVFATVDMLRSQQRLAISALEFLDARSLALAQQRSGKAAAVLARSKSSTGGALFIECETTAVDEDQTTIELLDILEANGASVEASIAGSDSQTLESIKLVRHAVPESINGMVALLRQSEPALHKVATDMSVPNSELRWLYETYERVLSEANLSYFIFGHIGDNHFHVNIVPSSRLELARAFELYEEIGRQVVAHGGCVAAEHGIGRIKRRFLGIEYPAEILTQMKAIKRFFDPRGRMNPGALFPAEDTC